MRDDAGNAHNAKRVTARRTTSHRTFYQVGWGSVEGGRGIAEGLWLCTAHQGRPWECEECGKAYETRTGLVKHMDSGEGGDGLGRAGLRGRGSA